MTTAVVGWPPGEEFLPDERQFVLLQVLEGEFVAPAEGTTIDEEHVLAVGVLDAEIIAPGPELLLEDVAHRTNDNRITSERTLPLDAGTGKPKQAGR